MNAIVKNIAAAVTAFALTAAVTLSATDAPATLDLASAGVDMAASEYALDMGAEFAAEDNTQTAFLFWLILAIVTAVVGVSAAATGAGTIAILA